MSSFNKVVIMGNLTREVDLRYTPAGKAVAELNVAVNRKNGDRDEVCFLKVTVWGKLAENCQIYLAKGSSVMVGGHLKQDNWEDRQTGNKRSSISIVAETVQFISLPRQGQGAAAPPPRNDYGSYGPQSSAGRRYPPENCLPPVREHNESKDNGYQLQPDIDDDIPF